jgi:hypothetical protein
MAITRWSCFLRYLSLKLKRFGIGGCSCTGIGLYFTLFSTAVPLAC